MTSSYLGPQPGQPGITYSFVNPTDASVTPDWTNSLGSTYPKTKKLWTSMETLWNTGDDTAMHVLDGWFKAPADGRYRFYIAADDQYQLFLDSANPFDAASPVTTSLTNIGQSWWIKGWRNYFHLDQPTASQGKFRTDWITLQEGKFYKIRGQNRDTGGGMFSNVAMEFERPGSETHPMATKAVQNWRIKQDNVPETWKIEILNPNSQKFKLGLKSPKETEQWVSPDIECNISANQMAYRLDNFFSRSATVSSGISVTLVMYDVNNVVTTVSANSKKNVYTIKLTRRITGFSFTAANVYPVGTITPKITVTKPGDVGGEQSSAPLAGKFRVKCGTETSPSISYD